MDLHPAKISAAEPVGPAIERVKQVLFKPFSAGKWFAIGFCAWLAGSGGAGFHYNRTYHYNNLSPGNGTTGGQPGMPPEFMHARDYVVSNLSWIIPLAIVIFVAFLVLGVVFSWLHSRGTFMLLHCVAVNRGEVAAPWRKYAREAFSLWIFRLCLGAVWLVLSLPILGTVGWVVIGWMIHKQQPDAGGILALFGIMMIWMGLVVVIALVNYFTRYFVVAIMYLRGGTCMQAWGIFLRLLERNLGRFIIYLLFQILIGLAVGALFLAFVIGTLFIGALLLVIPYIGTVVMLPVIVFYRSYTLYYLAQFGPEFDVFAAAQSTPPPLPVP